MDPSLQTPCEAVTAERTMRSKLYGFEAGSPLPREYHKVVYLKLSRIFVYVNKKVRL
jgi:hypothetical protein